MSISTSTQIDLNTQTLHRGETNRARVGGIFKAVFTKLPRKLLLALLGLVVLGGLYLIFFNQAPAPAKVLPLSQNFQVVAKTQDGKTTNGKLQIQVTGAQKATSMLVQGQNVIVKNNKVFLIVNMEITNSYLVPLYTYPVDSFRLVAADGKKFAPTTHQGNVEIRPESTKTSTAGFVVPQDQKRFKVEVGDLTSNRVILEFSLN